MKKKNYIHPLSEIMILQGCGIMQEGFAVGSGSEHGLYGAPERREKKF